MLVAHCPCPLIAVTTARTRRVAAGGSVWSDWWFIGMSIAWPFVVSTLWWRNQPPILFAVVAVYSGYCSLYILEPLCCCHFAAMRQKNARVLIAACCSRCSTWCDTWPSSNSNSTTWATATGNWQMLYMQSTLYLPCKLKSNTCCLIWNNKNIYMRWSISFGR